MHYSYYRVFALHEKCVRLKAEYNQALQQAEIQRKEMEKQKQANIIHTDQYKFLQRCIALADKYQASSDVLVILSGGAIVCCLIFGGLKYWCYCSVYL